MQSAKLVSSVQFDNKGGAGGTIGLAQFINSAKGDPNAVMIGGMVMVGAIYLENSPVNLTMVTPLARLTGEYEIIVVPASSPYKTMGDLVKAFKANPGSISWGGGSAGGTDHILAGLIAKATGVDAAKVNYVPFKGGGEAIAAIVGGHVTAGVSGIGEFSEQIKGGRMRALAVSSPSRVEGFATLKEQGIDVDLANWRGVFGAPGITTRPARRADQDRSRRNRIGVVEDDCGKARLVADLSRRRRLTRNSSMRTPNGSPPSSTRSASKVSSRRRMMKAKPAELALSLSVLGLGIAVAIGTSQLSGAGGYARIGPNVAPAIIAGGLILLGAWLSYRSALRRLAQRDCG